MMMLFLLPNYVHLKEQPGNFVSKMARVSSKPHIVGVKESAEGTAEPIRALGFVWHIDFA